MNKRSLSDVLVSVFLWAFVLICLVGYTCYVGWER
jgi:hypothetical protein